MKVIDFDQSYSILNLVLSYLVFVKHAIYHTLYIIQIKSTRGVPTVLCSRYNFLCEKSSTYVFKEFLYGIKKFFPVTSKEGPELSCINLRIIQYTYGISTDQTYQIQYTTLSQWYPYASERFNCAPTPFNSYNNFDLDISETLPATPAKFHHLEERYLGIFSAHIGKFSTLCNTTALI